MQITLDQLISIAKEAEYKNPIEWGELSVNEDQVYEIYAKALYMSYTKTSPENKELIMLAALIKLQVENYALSETIGLQSKTISALMKK